jgi:hypothetical protein
VEVPVLECPRRNLLGLSVGLVAYYAGHAAADAIQRYGIYAAGVIAAVVVGGFFLTRFGRKRLESRL